MVANKEKCHRGEMEEARERERERVKKKNLRIALKPMPRPHPNEVCFRPHTVRNLELAKVVTKW